MNAESWKTSRPPQDGSKILAIFENDGRPYTVRWTSYGPMSMRGRYSPKKRVHFKGWVGTIHAGKQHYGYSRLISLKDPVRWKEIGASK